MSNPRLSLASAGSAADRHTEQFPAWYATHGRAVYRYLRFHVDSADTADDLTADVFFHALQTEHRYDPARAAARVWIFTIARNALRDYFRRKNVRRHVALGALRDVAVDAPSAEERLLREEEIARLFDAVAELQRHDRELIALRYGSELSFAEIAEVAEMSEGAARTRVWRALARLRACMDRKP